MKNTTNKHSSDTELQKLRCVRFTDYAFAKNIVEQAYWVNRSEEIRGFQNQNCSSPHSLTSVSQAI